MEICIYDKKDIHCNNELGIPNCICFKITVQYVIFNTEWYTTFCKCSKKVANENIQIKVFTIRLSYSIFITFDHVGIIKRKVVTVNG